MQNPIISSRGQINVVLNHQEKSRRSRQQQQFLSSEEREKHYVLERVEKELESLVGLTDVRRFLKEVYAWLYINKCRKEQGLKVTKQSLHMIFKGNPGTGKTTVARLIAKFFYEMNVLSKGHLIEVERADLVGEYIGHTAQKTRDMIKKAQGGVLFIDEAYSLARGGEKDFGKEAIDTLVKSMEDQQHDFVLILAGYSAEMDYFLSLNPGLPSRFPVNIDFPDYTTDELMEIGRRLLDEREYRLTKDGEWKVRDYLKRVKAEHKRAFSNGRFIRNLIEQAIRAQAVRLLAEDQYNRDMLTTLCADDFDFENGHVEP
ncbi:stage V sporulation protein K [Desertibacillus haloalkaliphilus]|uniref:stage V sporulation protein K n=1 Tax=Desertibacillus haloalkaliphilus TaxID=1328930 RepID=UPI001C26B52F|nr:stage V sporulation protein K [Desertibacillus haloalkaliphilus]MBU8907383.1 stage V sporulation protein K [Desertibacillus haloalkaliphilus]